MPARAPALGLDWLPLELYFCILEKSCGLSEDVGRGVLCGAAFV